MLRVCRQFILYHFASIIFPQQCKWRKVTIATQIIAASFQTFQYVYMQKHFYQKHEHAFTGTCKSLGVPVSCNNSGIPDGGIIFILL